jgi:repressor LexA
MEMGTGHGIWMAVDPRRGEQLSIKERITMLREERKMIKKELAKVLHVSPSLVSEWEGGTRTVRPEYLVKLADYFDVTVDWLMGRDAPRSLSPCLPPGAWPLGSMVKVPVLGVIRAVEPLIAEQNIVAWEEVPMDMVRDGDYFFLQVSGDSVQDMAGHASITTTRGYVHVLDERRGEPQNSSRVT